ncbi:hypothetical protein P3L10_016362 [Capsicum annuum]
MLVHLRCLRISMQAKALPPSFSNLCNLETLVVDNSRSNLDLFCLWFGYSLDFSMECSAPEQIYFPRLDVLDKLEMVSASFKYRGRTHVHQFDFHFPSSLKVVYLVGFHLASDELSRIGRSLPNLQKLRLYGASIEGGKEWNMEQVTFHNLKSLQLVYMFFSEWQVIADESFPMLEKLYIPYCTEFIEIPESFGDIASLKLISMSNSPQLEESTLKINEYVEEMTGEDKLEVEY